jgi:hypothetical protein
MDDKRDYKEALKVLDASATVAATLNRLGALSVDTEDEKLRQLVEAIAAVLRQQHAKPTSKIRLKDVRAPHPNVGDVARLAQLIDAAWKYAKACRDAGDKQWQILARQAGWTPPA